MGRITTDQSQAVMATLMTNINWPSIDFEKAGLQDAVLRNPVGAGQRATDFLNNGCHVIISDPKLVKTIPFDPTKFIGKGWSTWRGPADGDGLSGEEDIDPRSLNLVEVDVDKFLFETCLGLGETSIRRLKENTEFIRFGGSVFLGLWEDYQTNRNKKNSALERIYQNFEITFMDFPGQILRDPDGDRNVLYLDRDGDGEWNWNFYWLIYRWDVDYPSVGCAS